MPAAPYPRCYLVVAGDNDCAYPVPGHCYERLVTAMGAPEGVVEIETLDGTPLAFPARRLATVVYIASAAHERRIRAAMDEDSDLDGF